MNQVSMSTVNLDETEARFTGTTCGRGKSRNDALNTVGRERPGHRIASRESQGAGRNDILPPPFTFGHRSVPRRRRISARLATGMCQLHSSHATLLMNEPHDSGQRLNMIIHPDAQVPGPVD